MDVNLKTDQGKAVVEGKTAVPFKTFVGLILQRKVLNLFKDWGQEPIIISAELLTDLASAQQDNPENREQLITVTLGVGVLCGVFALAVLQIALVPWGITLTGEYLLAIAGTLFGIAFLTWLMGKVKRRSKGHKLSDTMEKITGMMSK